MQQLDLLVHAVCSPHLEVCLQEDLGASHWCHWRARLACHELQPRQAWRWRRLEVAVLAHDSGHEGAVRPHAGASEEEVKQGRDWLVVRMVVIRVDA